MKIIHSFWSKPAFHSNQNHDNARKFGGWLNYKYFLYSTCFSCLTLKRHHKKIDLFTDDKGADIFINQLNLPYDNVSLLLNDLAEEDHRLWVLGKLKTIAAQQEPFMHIDNDVYLWREIPTDYSHPYLIAQSQLLMPTPYRNALNEVFEHFDHIPSCLLVKPTPQTKIANIGIIGGNDLGFFQEYCATAYTFLENNKEKLPQINIGFFNQILDEYLFTCLANEKEFPVQCLINDPYDDKEMLAVLRFHLVPVFDKYIHLVGIAKQNVMACEQLELRFEYEFPQEYKAISAVIKEIDPSLINADSTLIHERKEKLTTAIHKLYTCTLPELQNLKIKLRDDVKIVELKGEDNLNSAYGISFTDTITKEEVHRELSGADGILAYFDSPLSMQELLEELTQNLGSNNPQLEQQKFKLIDIITEKIMIDGILEFV
ncbi:MAG: DUF6734 family protein [Bacteroidota bacterium]